MLNRKYVLKTIKTAVADNFYGESYEITEESEYGADLGLDSLDRIEMGMNLEDAYGVDIPDKIVLGWLTVAQTIDYILDEVGEL